MKCIGGVTKTIHAKPKGLRLLRGRTYSRNEPQTRRLNCRKIKEQERLTTVIRRCVK